MVRISKVLLLALFVLLGGCKERVNNPEPLPPRPIFVAASADTAALEHGIDAIPEENAIFLEWRTNAAYETLRLYRKKGNAAAFALLAAPGLNDTTFVDRVDVGVRYYYYLVAEDASGISSAPSDTIDYQLLPKAINLSVSHVDTMRFHWQIQGIRPVSFILRLYDESTQEIVWLSVIPPSYQGDKEEIAFDWDGKARRKQLLQGTQYRWRIDCVGSAAFSGSESGWHRFVML